MLGKLKRIDWLIVFVLACFAGFSYLLIDSAIYNYPRYKYSGMATKMLYVYGLSFVVLIVTSLINYRIVTKFWYVLYAIGIGLLIAVRYYGAEFNGARSWFVIREGLTFQPAELMKIILVIAIAGYLQYRKGEPLRLVQEVLPVGLISLLPFTLILIQPDLGSACCGSAI